LDGARDAIEVSFPSEMYARCLVAKRARHRTCRLSLMELQGSSEFHTALASALLGSGTPLLSLMLRTSGLQGFYASGSLLQIEIQNRSTLLSFHSPTEITRPRTAASQRSPIRRSNIALGSASRGFSSPTAFLCDGQRHEWNGVLPAPNRLHLRVFSTPWCFHPPVRPSALFHTEYAHGVLPSKLRSPDAADHRLQQSLPSRRSVRAVWCLRRPAKRRSTEVPRRPNQPPCGGPSCTPRDRRALVHTGIRHAGRAV
jgi:hypothetical protein